MPAARPPETPTLLRLLPGGRADVRAGLERLRAGTTAALLERAADDVRADLLLVETTPAALPTQVYNMLVIYRALFLDVLVNGGPADAPKWEYERQLDAAARFIRRRRRQGAV